MNRTSPPQDEPLEFAALLDESFEEIDNLGRGDIRKGTILAIDKQGLIIDVGLKRDGVVPRADLDSLGDDICYEVGQDIEVMVVRLEDQDGNLILSIRQALANKDWEAAR
ncbi:MAG: S1 RNA-binding domain-containing protein, partial [Chloroflexota bacterium]